MTWFAAKHLFQQPGICGWLGIPVPLGGNGGRLPVPTGAVPTGAVPTGAVPTGAVPIGAVPIGAVPNGIECEAEIDTDGVALAETPVPLGILKEKDELPPVGTGLRQKSFSHQLYFPLSVALQREEMQVSTIGPMEGAHKARGSVTLLAWKHPVQQTGNV